MTPSRSRCIASTMFLLGAIISTPVSAQRIPAAVQFQEFVSISASMEFVLTGVSDLSDVQRDSVEHIEQALRDTILRHALAIRRHKDSQTPWWSAEQINFEREINAIVAARSAAMDRVRRLLDKPQQTIFDRNALKLRGWDVAYWSNYAAGNFTRSVVDQATVP